MKLNIGFNVWSETSDPELYILQLEHAYQANPRAVELNLGEISRFPVLKNERIADLFAQFEYRSIHLPARTVNGSLLRYPSPDFTTVYSSLMHFIEKTDPQTVLVHPIQVDDFSWVVSQFGDKLALENMDYRAQKYKIAEDFAPLFEKFHTVKFVLDINHIYTNDPSMVLAQTFHTMFADRLTHYHISAFGGFHSPFTMTHEDIILTGILDANHPLIHEGDALQKGIVAEECAYIESHYKQ